METQFNNYLCQYELAETSKEKQLLTAQFATIYNSLSSEDKHTMNQAMNPSLLELKAWTEREIDPLLTRAEILLARKLQPKSM